MGKDTESCGQGSNSRYTNRVCRCPDCTAAHSAYTLSRYHTNAAQIRARTNAKYPARREAILAYQATRRTEAAATARARYARNAEKERERQRRKYAATREATLERNRAWRLANPDAANAIAARRRAHKLNAPEVDPTVSLAAVFVRDRGQCQLCSGRVREADASMDHIRPLSKGGAHSWANVQLAHRRCNSRKGTRSVPRFGLPPLLD